MSVGMRDNQLAVLVVDRQNQELEPLVALLNTLGVHAEVSDDDGTTDRLIHRSKLHGVFLAWDDERNTIEILAKLQASSSNANVPITMMVNTPDISVIADGHDLGIKYALQRPLHPTHIRSVLAYSLRAMLEERRNYERVSVALPLSCIWGAQKLDGSSVNLSSTGLLGRFESPIEVGAEVRLDVHGLDRGQNIALRGEVVRKTEVGEVGVRFLELNSVAKKWLFNCLEDSRS